MWKLLAVARKEFRQIARDTRTLLMLLFVPAFFLLLYGYALNFDIRHVRLAVDDRDHSSESRALVSAFLNSGYFDLAAVADQRNISALLDRGAVRAALVIPEDFARDLQRGQPTAVQVLLDGDNANVATTVMGYAITIVRTEGLKYLPEGSGEGPLVSVEPRVWYNPELRSTLFLVPGLIAYITMITAVVSTALSIVKEKERGTMEQVRMAPIGPASFVVGKTLPYFIISFISVVIIVAAGMLLFGMPMRGSWLLLWMAVSLFLFGALGIGLFISTIAETQQVAFQAAILASFLPSFILSGFIFPISSMPSFLQIVTYAIPARYFLVALRGIMLKGAGLNANGSQFAALAVFAVAVLALASVRLRRDWS